MLYLVIENGKPLHKWSLDPIKDGLTVIGEPILDDEGKISDSAWLAYDGQTVSFDKNLKDQAKAQEKAKGDLQKAKRVALKALKDKPNKTLKDLEDLVNFLAENVL